jgi:hypothetical protein
VGKNATPLPTFRLDAMWHFVDFTFGMFLALAKLRPGNHAQAE